jgi:hypothetical protein
MRLALAVLFLAAGAGRASGLTPCPHHDSSVAPSSHGVEHAAHAGHVSDEQAPASHGGCNCVGACHAGAATPAPAAPAPEHALAAGDATVITIRRAEPRPALTPYLRPYSTAPPAGR